MSQAPKSDQILTRAELLAQYKVRKALELKKNDNTSGSSGSHLKVKATANVFKDTEAGLLKLKTLNVNPSNDNAPPAKPVIKKPDNLPAKSRILNQSAIQKSHSLNHKLEHTIVVKKDDEPIDGTIPTEQTAHKSSQISNAIVTPMPPRTSQKIQVLQSTTPSPSAASQHFATPSIAFEHLQESLAQSSHTQIAQQIELETRQNEVNSLRHLSASLQSQLSILRSEMNEQSLNEEAIQSQMEQGHNETKTACIQLGEELATCKRIIDDKEYLITELENIVSTLRVEIENLNAAPKAYADLWILQVKIEQITAELEQKKIDVSGLKEENELLKYDRDSNIISAKVVALELENVNLKVELQSRFDTILELDQNKDAAAMHHRENKSLKIELRDRNDKLRDFDQIKQQLVHNESALESLNIENAALKLKLNESIPLESHRIELSAIRSQLESINFNVNDLTVENTDLKDEIKDCMECIELMEQMEMTQVVNETRIKVLEDALLANESQLFAFTSESNENVERILHLEFKYSQLLDENIALKDGYEISEKQLAVSQGELKDCFELIQLVDEQEARMGKLEDEKRELVQMYELVQRQVVASQDKIQTLQELIHLNYRDAIEIVDSESGKPESKDSQTEMETYECKNTQTEMSKQECTDSQTEIQTYKFKDSQTDLDLKKLDTDHQQTLSNFQLLKFTTCALQQHVHPL